jgi:hypothetical protein
VTVAALFVDETGVYSGLPDVEVWGEKRDARTYTGPWSVVAHPPCQLWINYAELNFKRYGGGHNMPRNDGGCFASALHSVRLFGGVLEHPAFSKAWDWFDLPKPPRHMWGHGRKEWVCEVWQSAYGHKARKRTWLYYVGDEQPPELDWTRPTGTAQIGWFDRVKPVLSKQAANATPIPFRDLLLSIARSAKSTTRASAGPRGED